MDGNYSISVPKGKQLEITYVGYKKEVIIAKEGKMTVQLKEDSNMLNEVVAIGYGTVKRKDVTGSVSSVGNTELVSVPVASPVEAMQGKLAGVRVTMPEGNPRRRGHHPRAWWWFYHPRQHTSLYCRRFPPSAVFPTFLPVTSRASTC